MGSQACGVLWFSSGSGSLQTGALPFRQPKLPPRTPPQKSSSSTRTTASRRTASKESGSLVGIAPLQRPYQRRCARTDSQGSVSFKRPAEGRLLVQQTHRHEHNICHQPWHQAPLPTEKKHHNPSTFFKTIFSALGFRVCGLKFVFNQTALALGAASSVSSCPFGLGLLLPLPLSLSPSFFHSFFLSVSSLSLSLSHGSR